MRAAKEVRRRAPRHYQGAPIRGRYEKHTGTSSGADRSLALSGSVGGCMGAGDWQLHLPFHSHHHETLFLLLLLLLLF